jgi:outer membrane protein
MFVLLLALLWAAAPSVRCQQEARPTGEVLTLDEAIAIALRDNRSIKNARLGVEKSDEQLSATRTARLPVIKFHSIVSEDLVKHDVNLPNPVSNLVPGLAPFFTLSTPRRPTAVFAVQALQPISQQYRIGLAVDLAKLEGRMEQEKLRAEQQSLVGEVKRAYYAILLTESGLRNVRDEVASYRELERVTGEYVLQQAALRGDQLQVQTRLAKAEYDMADLGNRLATQKEQLNRLMGRDVFTEFSVTHVSQTIVFEADAAAARRRAAEQRPELRQARLRVEQARLDRRMKRSEYIPDVSAGFTSLTLRNFDAVVPRNIASVGVVMSWEVFDWGRKKHQLAEKSKTIEQAENAANEIEDQILIDVSDKFRRLQQTGLALRVAKVGCETAREKMRVMIVGYKQSTMLLSDVLQSQASVSEADHQYQQALLSFWTAKAEYEKALGDDK